jgi:hypothetical protein
VAVGQVNDLAEELLIDVAEGVGRDDGEGVGALRVIEGRDDFLKDGVVEREAEREAVGGLVAALLGLEVEETGVVAQVGVAADVAEARVDLGAGGEGLELTETLDAAVLGDAQEDDPVEDALDGEVEIALGEAAVAQGQVFGEAFAPGLHVGEEVVVELGGAALAFGGGGEFVEGAVEHGGLGEDAGDLIPLRRVVLIGAVEESGGGGLVVFLRSGAAVVDGELVEVGDDAKAQLGGVGIAAELFGGFGVVLNPNGGLLGLDEKLAGAADAEGVIGGRHQPADLQGVLMDDVLVGLGMTGAVEDIPAKGVKERVEELATELRLLVVGREVGIEVAAESLDAFEDARRDRHEVGPQQWNGGGGWRQARTRHGRGTGVLAPRSGCGQFPRGLSVLLRGLAGSLNSIGSSGFAGS